jgi:methionyl-tRNA synthetase
MQEENLGIRVGTIVSAEKVKGTDRLHIIKINLGDETRQIVSGVPADLEPGYLIGKQVPVKVDVQPMKIRGLESTARFLAVSGENKETVVLLPHKSVPNGSVVW